VFVPRCLELIADLHSGGLAIFIPWFEATSGRLHSCHVGSPTRDNKVSLIVNVSCERLSP
jgi:hypothetical protein